MNAPISARIYADLVGKPFALHGRGPREYDCLGLAMEFQRRRGLALPAYLSDVEELHRAIADGGQFSEAHRLEAAEPGCVVLLRSPGSDYHRHIGCMVDRFRMLHASEDAGASVLEVLTRCAWSRRVLGFYRVESAL